MKRRDFFRTAAFNFETTRVLWYAPVGGADYGEVRTALNMINDGDYESWYAAWRRLGDQLVDYAARQKQPIAKGSALLRANRYYAAAEFYLSHTDPRKLAVYEDSVRIFTVAMKLLDISLEAHDVTYDGVPLRTLFFPTNGASRGVIFACGGFDATLEELYFTIAANGVAHGYDVVLYELPGQSNVIRYHDRPFEPNPTAAIKTVVDWYREHRTVERSIGLGLSLGGYIVASAAGHDPQLFDDIVLFNYFPAPLAAYGRNVPAPLRRYLNADGFPPFIARVIEAGIRLQPYQNWQTEHAKWVFGAPSFNQLIQQVAVFDEVNWPEAIKSRVLVLAATDDDFYDADLARRFFARLAPTPNNELVIFDENDFSNQHCQNGAYYQTQDTIFSWLAASTNKDSLD